MKIAPGLVELLAEAKQDVPDKLKQIARAYHVSILYMSHSMRVDIYFNASTPV